MGAFLAAILASRHVSRLQHQVEQQRFGERRVRRDLERLSARLVDIQERERREISRELHDAIGQALTAVKMDIGIALRGEVSDRTRAALDEAKDITETTLQSVRDLSQLLHPSMLDDFGLPQTVRTYLCRFAERTSIRAQLVAAMPDRLPPEIEGSLYRIIQEAMNDIARHSGANACNVTINTLGARAASRHRRRRVWTQGKPWSWPWLNRDARARRPRAARSRSIRARRGAREWS